ncbi:MAG TPA: isoprenylcysteine carboxylmethyltransferase family protein [Syntrophobacteraceae bacterium]|nr:isoprenylcysteine carboxylmethyltransferase family protein [Syntrophobacteraceae bacterium]
MIRKDFTPAVMSILLLLGIIILTLARHWRIPGLWTRYPLNWDAVFTGLYVLWLLVEIPTARKDVNTEGKKTLDFATCQIYGCAQAFTFLSALWFPSVWNEPNFAHFAGMGLFLFGVSYRFWAIRTLGVFYSHRVRTLSRHRIVDSGPYRFTRHPAYAGMIIANAGVVLYFFNWVTLCIFLFALVPGIVLRIVVEERMLSEIEGYSDFARDRKRLFPGIW